MSMCSEQREEPMNGNFERLDRAELDKSPPENDTVETGPVLCLEAMREPFVHDFEKFIDQSEEETLLNSSWRSPLDYRSTSSETSKSSWGNETIAQMRFTLTSNMLFFVSATIQSIMATSDLKYSKEEALEDDDWDDDWEDDKWDDEYVYTNLDRAYYVFYSMAPFLFLVSAILDVQYYGKCDFAASCWWSWCPCCVRNENNSTVEIEDLDWQEEYHPIVQVNTSDAEGTMSDDDDNDSNLSSVAPSVHHDAHWHLTAAIIFGLAAALEFYGTFLYDYYEDCDDWDDDAYLIEEELKRKWYVSNYRINFLSMHLYLLSGVVTLISQRSAFMSRFNCLFRNDDDEGKPESDARSTDRFATVLMVLGTILFTSGTLMDCTVAWLDDPSIRQKLSVQMDSITISRFSLTSCLFWNIDAVLYIWADILLYSLHKEDSEGRKRLFQFFREDGSVESEDEVESVEEEDENVEEQDRFLDDETLPILPDSPCNRSYSSIQSDDL